MPPGFNILYNSFNILGYFIISICSKQYSLWILSTELSGKGKGNSISWYIEKGSGFNLWLVVFLFSGCNFNFPVLKSTILFWNLPGGLIPI